MENPPDLTTLPWLQRIAVSREQHGLLVTAGRELDRRFPARELSNPRLQMEALRFSRDRWPGLQGLLDDIPALIARDGAVLINDVPLEHDSLLVTLCATLGVVTPEGNGPPGRPGMLIYDVAPSVLTDELSKTYDGLDLHTDSAFEATPHAYMALGCLVADPSGGGRSLLVRVDDAVATLRRLGEGEVVERLEDQVFPLELSRADQGPGLEEVAVLEPRGRGHTVRYRADMLQAGFHANVRHLTAAHKHAVNRFAAVISQLARQAGFPLLPGDLLLFDNRRMLHGRTPITSGVARHLKRLKMRAVPT